LNFDCRHVHAVSLRYDAEADERERFHFEDTMQVAGDPRRRARGRVVSYDPATGYGDPATARPTSGKVYGRVYELFTTRPDLDGEHPYAGKTRKTIHQRVHGRSSSAHTSAQSIEKDPWKARIRPGKAGYRQLEVVYATGDDAADERELRRAEAFWIDRLNTTHNDVRPVRPPVHRQPAGTGRTARRATRPTVRPPSRQQLAERKARARARRRVFAFLFLVVVATYFAAEFVVALRLPWPAAPYVAAPVVGTFAAWPVFRFLDRARRYLTGRK
jgi:hypothetical protein